MNQNTNIAAADLDAEATRLALRLKGNGEVPWANRLFLTRNEARTGKCSPETLERAIRRAAKRVAEIDAYHSGRNAS